MVAAKQAPGGPIHLRVLRKEYKRKREAWGQISRLFEDDLKRNVCYPIWPHGIQGIVPPLLWMWALAYKEHVVWAWRIFWFLSISHAVEAVLVLLWLQPVGFTYTAKLAWALPLVHMRLANHGPCEGLSRYCSTQKAKERVGEDKEGAIQE